MLRLNPRLAPCKVAVLPLQRRPELAGVALELHARLQGEIDGLVEYDETGSIGRRYRRQDEIGTPFCVTVDTDTPRDGAATVRERDTMAQVRMPLAEVVDYLSERLGG